MLTRRYTLMTPLALLATPALAQAQSQAPWPNRPTRIVVPIAAGGALDITARMLAERLQAQLGQPFVVENRAGAGGNIGSQHVAQSPADGHTLMLAAANTLAANKFLYGTRMPIDPLKDLGPVTRVSTGTILMAVNAGRPWRNFAELIAFAKANPGRVSMGSSGTGTTSHLFIERVKRAADVDITHVPYRGGGPAIQDLVAGNIDMMFDVMPALMPHVREGRIRALAVGSAARVTFVPGLENVPGMNEVLPGQGIDAQAWYGMVSPANMPAAVLEKVHASVLQVVREPAFGERLAPLGFQTVTDATPAAFLAFWREEENRWKQLVEISGATAE